MPSHQPAASISAVACRTRATSVANARFVATMIWSAPTARAAINAPSSTSYGLLRRIVRSLKVPGSPSAAFTTTEAGSRRDRFVADRPPLASGRESGAAATAQTRGDDLVDDGVGVALRRGA